MKTIFNLLKMGLILAFFAASILAPGKLSAQITNDGFESGTTGWTGSGFTTSTGETVLDWNVQPADGQMGRITPGVAASTAQSTLGLTSSQLTGITQITNVGYVYQDINLTAGQEITVYWNYVSQDYSPYDDGTFASLTRSGEEQFKILARTFGTSDIGIPNTNAYGSTGWHTVSFTAGTTDTYRLGLGAFNWSDQSANPILYIDNAIGGTSSPQQPTVSTTNPSNISNNSATLGGQVSSAGSGSVTDRGIVYSSSNSSPTIGNGTQEKIGTGLGNYSTTVSGLTNGATYYVRAYAISSEGGTSYGGVKQFTTLSKSPPTVSTGSISNINEHSATGRVTVSADGGATITEYGVVYGTSSNPTTSNFKSSTNGAPTLGSEYTFNLTTLSANTTYYVRGFAANSAGTGYGTQTSFKTAPPVPVATAATLVGESSFKLNWNASTGAIKYYLDISTSSDFSSFISGYNNKDVGNITSHNISGLNSGGTYYYRLRAYNGDATSGNSNTISTTTKVLDNFLVETFGEGDIPTQTAGQSFNIRITARDDNNERIIDYVDNTVVTSNGNLSDGSQSISSVTTGNFTGGIYSSQSVILTLTGNDRTITATKNGKTGTSNEFTVMPGPINYYTIVANPDLGNQQQSVIAGVAFDVFVTVYDEYDNIKTDYNGDKSVLWETTATPSRSGDIYEIPEDGVQTFNSGVATIGDFVLYDAEEQPTITITDGPTLSLGTTSPILIMPNDLNNFTLEENQVQEHSIGGVRVTAGENFSIKVTARDVYQNVKRDYEGNIQFKSSNDFIVEYPNELQQFTLADNGIRIFSNDFQIPTTGVYSLRVGDNANFLKAGALENIIVRPGAYSTSASEFTATSATTGLTAGDYVNVLITPRDAEGNLLCDCQDVAVKLNGETYDWDSDPNPISVTDNHDGTYTAAIRITQLGTNTLTASVGGSDMSTKIKVVVDNPATPSYLAISGTKTQVAGIAQDITITAYDEFHNKAISYTGTKQIRFGGASASNAPITNPIVEGTSFANNTSIDFADGEAIVAMILYKVESAKVTATDWTTDSKGITTPDDVIDGETTYVYQLPVEVTPAAADYFAISGSAATQKAGTSQNITLTAYDEFNNMATDYSGTKQIRFGGATPSNAPGIENPTVEAEYFGTNTEMDFTNGAVTVSMALFKAESAKITAADWTSGSEGIISPDDVIDGGSTYVYQLPVVVNATSPSYFAITGSDTQTAGVAQNITITMFDQYNNIATSYDGDMDLTFTGAYASFDGIKPAVSSTEFGNTTTVTFSNGVAENVSMTLFDAANETQDALVNVSNGSQSATGQELAVNVIPNSATKLRINTEPSADVRAGNELDRQPVISIRDAYGNMVDDNTTTVTATATGTESLVGTTEITAVNGIVSFIDLSYQKMETITIDFDANLALTPVTSGSILVDHNATVKYVYSTTPLYIYAGGQRGAYTVERYDAYDNLVNNVVNPDGSDSNADETVFLYSDNTDVNTKFYDVATGGSALTSVPISNGATSVNFWYYSEKEGKHLITASDKSSLDAPDEDTENATNTLEVKPAALHEFVVSGIGTDDGEGGTEHYYGDRQTVKVEAIDIFGNRKINYTGTVTFSLTDAEANETEDAGNNYPSNYTFTEEDKGIHTFTDAILFERPSFENPDENLDEWWVTVLDSAQFSKFGAQKSIKVLKRPITITAHNQTKQYYGNTYDLGSTEFTVTSGITEYQNPDVFAGTEGISNVTLSSDGTDASALAGDYQIVPSNVVGINDFNEDYYDITFEDGTLSVDPRPITITVAANQSKTYGDVDPSDYSFTVTSGSLTDGDSFTGKLTREPGENAGSYKVLLAGLSIVNGSTDKTSNYNITFKNDNKFEITPKTLVVTANSGQSKIYGQTDPAFAYTAAGFEFSDDETVFTGALSRDAGENVDNYPITIGTLAAGINYTISFNSNDFEITPKTLVVTANSGQNKTYGQTDPAFAYTAAGFEFSDDETVFTGALSRDAGENVDKYPMTIGTLVAGINYTISFNSNDFEITPKTLVVTANSGQSKTYGQTDPAFAYTAAGFEFSDDETVFTGALSRDAGENVDRYPITIGTLAAGINYTISFNSNDFEITPKTLVVTANSGQSKIYGQTDPAFAYTAAGFEFSDDKTVFTGALSRDAGENVDNYPITIGTLAAGINYTISFNSNDFEITPKTLVVTANSGQSKTYGQTDPAFAYTAAGFEFSDDETVFTGALSRDAGENVDRYPITIGTLAAGINYTISFNSNDFEITPKTLVVTANSGQSKIYGQTDPAFAYTAAGFEFSDDKTVFTGALSRDAGENVDNYPITIGTLAAGINYTISFNSNDFEITPKTLVVTANSGQNKIYGQTDPAFAYTAAGFEFSDDKTVFTGALSRDAGENVDNYPMTIGTLAAGINYTISFNSNDFEITPKTLVVTANSGQSKIYGQTDPAFAYTAAGFEFSDDETVFTGALSRDAGENVDNYPMTIGTLAAGINYTISFNSNDFEITPKTLVVTANSGQNKIYGQTDPAFAYTAAGFEFSDEKTVFTGALSRDAGENVDNYPMTIGTLAAGINYTISFNSNDFEITPKTLVVTANSGQNKIYGQTDPAFAYTAAGFEFSDDETVFTGALSRDPGENVDNYPITIGTLAAGINYTIGFNSNDFEITPKTLVVTANSGQSKTYGQTDPAFAYTAAGFEFSDDETVFTGALSRDAGENVDNYPMTIGTLAAGINYTISFNSNDFEITKMDVTVTADANQSKTYGDMDPVYTYTAIPAVGSTLANNEVIGFSGQLDRVAGEEVDFYAIGQGTVDNSNYNITFVSDTFEITKRRVTVAADAYQSKTYGDLDPVFTYASNPVLGSKLPNNEIIHFNGELVRTEGENVGLYAIEQGTLDNSNYEITFVSNNFEIAPLDVTVTVNADQNKTYGDLDPVFEYSSIPAVGTTLTNSEVIGFTGVLDRAAGENTGLYAIGQGTLGNPNYSINFMTDNFEITKLEVTVTADADQSKTYGELDPVFEYSSIPAVGTTLANSEVIGFTGVLDRAAGENAGLYAIGQGTLNNPNYSINFMTDNFEITKLEVTVTADADQSKTYGELDPVFEYSSIPAVGTTLANSEVIGFTGVLDRAAGEDAGSYEINLGTLSNSNYNIAYVGDIFEITTKALTITADDKTKEYDGEIYSPFTVSYNGFVNDEDESVLEGALTFSGTAANAFNAGTDYVITPEGLTSTNYAITFVDGLLGITAKSLTITADNKSKIYDGEVYSPFTVSYDGFVGSENESNLDGELTFSGSALDATEVGADYIITPKGFTSSNYEIIYVSGSLIIVPYIAGDTNGDGSIDGFEIAGDTNGDGIISNNEVSGDIDGNGSIGGNEVAGDANGDGSIDGSEIAGDIDGNGSISGVEIYGDKNGDSQISGSEIAGDANGDGIIGAGEARMIDPNKDHINITKLFTPNNDGFNDYWKIDNILELGRVQVKIYDRAGKLLYESSAYQNDWDGTSKGKSVPEGAYIYHVKTELAGTTTGVVNIVR